jgi:mono/diheme cytochrome c family protein
LKLRRLLWTAALPLLLFPAACARKNLTTPGLYETYCARCHGDRGQGVARGLKLYPHLDFRASPLVRRGDRAAVREQIAEGDGPMPGFKRRLTAQEIDRLVDFTFQLGRTAAKED